MIFNISKMPRQYLGDRRVALPTISSKVPTNVTNRSKVAAESIHVLYERNKPLCKLKENEN